MKKLFFILMILFGTLSSHAERTALINNFNQITVSNIGSGTFGNLIDDNVNTSVHSQTGKLSDYCYIQVALHEELNLQENEDLIVYLQRCDHNENEAHPTAFKVQGSMDGENWNESWDTNIQSCHVYFLYRGPKTKEYSTRIRTSKNFKYLRFTVMANSGRKHDAAGHRYMGLAEFQIYKLGRDDNYSSTLVDRFHLTSDYYQRLAHCEFENTMGVLDKRNWKGGRGDNLDNWCDWTGWSKDGKWTKDKEILEKAGVSMPEYTMLTSENDDAHGYKPNPNQERQPTHVTEHILYAIPGDAIALYPYYSFTDNDNGQLYKTNFAHWYDYQSGGHLNITDVTTLQDVSMLDFLIDPSAVHKNDKYGYFAGEETGREGTIRTVEEYIAFVKSTNNPNGQKMEAVLANDLDFTGRTDVPSICENNYFQGILDGNGYKIKNLIMDRPEKDKVALIANAGNGAVIKNLIIDGSCKFIGKNKVAALIAEEQYGNAMTIENVQTYATVKAENGQAAAIIAYKGDYPPPVTIKNCFIGGSIKGNNAAAVVIWNGTTNLKISNTVSNAIVNSQDDNNYFTKNVSSSSIINCYGTYNDLDENHKYPEDPNSNDFITKLGNGWIQGSDEVGHVVPAPPSFEKANTYYGKVATFFCPRSPYAEEGKLQNLPFNQNENEFIIAADFSQSFSREHNLVENEKKIIEPIIQFRHIFRIRDGKEFAEEFSGSVKNNQEYVRKNLRHVSTRADVPFQIRLDSPIPQMGTTRSKYYYKISDTDYRRVCTMDIEVKNLVTGDIIPTNQPKSENYFYYGEEFNGEGRRVIDGITYNICGGGGKYYRMLKCDTPKEGRYLIRIMGKDINGNRIKVYDPETKSLSNTDLVVMEMELTVLPKESACMVSDENLYAENSEYVYAQEEELEKAYGAPKQRLTFDEYAALEEIENKNYYLSGNDHKYKLKWPMPWNDVTYAFDYNENRDYNMYTVASHSSQAPQNSAANTYTNPDGTKGLYDRLYYKTMRRDSKAPQYGYFYFVNASIDPGVMARLKLESMCMGSTVHISAWVAEFSGSKEVANISFNFIAVLNEANKKERVLLHSFISGYVTEIGKWMNVYYSFVPSYTEAGITPDMVDHYELELDNNCKSSLGADYAVDNIRIYVASPLIYAAQNEPICDPDVNVGVRIEAPFDLLLQVVGETEDMTETQEKDKTEVPQEAQEEESRTTSLYYTFIDKQKFDELYKKYTDENDPEPGLRAYNESVLKYNYTGKEDGKEQTFGMVSFNLNFASNPEYNNNYELSEKAWSKTDADGTRLIVFNTRPEDDQLNSGKEYYVSIHPVINGIDVTSPGWNEFNIKDPCARVCIFRVTPKSTIKIDGEMREDTDDITCCEEQSPVVQVDLYGKDEDNKISEEPIEKNARMDWYNGSYAEFQEVTSGEGKPLSDVLTYFRSEYPNAESIDDSVVPQGQLTQEMINYLKQLSEIQEGELRPKLSLSKTSYVFPPVKIPEGQDYTYCYVVAIPISTKPEDDVLLCLAPTEVRIRVQHSAPVLNHGLTVIEYPGRIEDVPLRIGLTQLKAVSAAEGSSLSGHAQLNIPIRYVMNAAQSATGMILTEGNPYIYLVETNDPAYKDLGTVNPMTHADIGTLMPVGEITQLTANVTTDGEDVSGTNNDNAFKVVFYDKLRFKEGHYYRMRFNFEENASDISVDDVPVVCNGQDVFTIKVVPEYQRWTGETNRNWNNDDNWSRVSAQELYLTDERKETLAEFVTDGTTNDGTTTNNRKKSYVPLDFTKVIIPKSTENTIFPYLNKYEGDDVIKDLSANYPDIIKGVLWPLDPSNGNAGNATPDIQYDMAAYNTLKSGNASINTPIDQITQVNCRPWYANTCEQIHFRPNSEIEGQQNLVYEKAWIDIATKPGRWYTLATPLKTVVAGDMYLPSDNAKQETELFTEINFDTQLNNRFKPAVYQRGWNKSTTKVYELNQAERNVAVKADWSNVYNDVTEAYGSGTGFSIKTDVSKMENNQVDEVLFRLPKSDEYFDYYSEDGKTTGNRTTITRQNNFRLNEAKGTIKSISAGNNRYFLVGNPFMAHLDMAKFLKANEGKINPKYWLLTEGSQGVAVFDEQSDGFVGSENIQNGKVAPLQSFFVEAKEGENGTQGSDVELVLDYTEDMACNESFSKVSLRSATRADNDRNVITISAIRNNRMLSQAFINFSPDADKAYNETDDAVLIDNSQLEIPAEVYTVADHTALSVNTTNQVNGTEIGLVAGDDNETMLMFEGVGELSDVSLYDAATRTRTPLSEGMKYTVKGSVAGRLFLKSDREKFDNGAQSIKVDINRRNVRVASGNNSPIAVKVYTAEGMMVVDKAEGSSVVEFNLGRGIYILEATDDVETEKRKIVIL